MAVELTTGAAREVVQVAAGSTINGMSHAVLEAAGGLGLFLLGMVVMTDGLKGLAGETLRQSLMRFTRSPLSGAATGAVATALLQSSSATTVAAVGFVSASLLTFPEALGVIFGANLGTTVTGWLVALVGFKLQLGTILLPMVLVGAMLRLFGRGRTAQAGLALAGFGLIFVGVGYLQGGLGGFEGLVTPERFPEDTRVGRLQLVMIGVAITLVTQSSSAGVAAAVAAVHTGTIALPQAAAMVIGMDVGTTVTAAIATFGGSVESRRTGYSHVFYNMFTGCLAFFLLMPYFAILDRVLPGAADGSPELVLVGFHTALNLIGLLLILPFTGTFARLVERLVPERTQTLAHQLDRSLLELPVIALQAVRSAIDDQVRVLFQEVRALLGNGRSDKGEGDLERVRASIEETQEYVDQIHLTKEKQGPWLALVAGIHTLDHMRRLQERCEEDRDRAGVALSDPVLEEPVRLLSEVVAAWLAAIDEGSADRLVAAAAEATRVSESLLADDSLRQGIMEEVARGEVDVPVGTDRLEAVRWIRRVAAHVARITKHAEEMHAAIPVHSRA